MGGFQAKSVRPELVTKTSIMLGLGETDDEVLQTMKGMLDEHTCIDDALLIASITRFISVGVFFLVVVVFCILCKRRCDVHRSPPGWC